MSHRLRASVTWKEIAEIISDIAAPVVALVAVYMALRTSKFEARRAYVELIIKIQAETAAELVRTLVRRVQLCDEGRYWTARAATFPPGSADRLTAEKQVVLRRDEWIPPNTERMNAAVATAHTVFSDRVREAAHAIVVHTNRAMDNALLFDADTARTQLATLSRAIREEMLVDEVIPYQRSLFPKRSVRSRT